MDYNKSALFYKFIDEKLFKLTLFDTSRFETDTKFNATKTENIETLIKTNPIVASSINKLRNLGYNVQTLSTVVNNFISLNDKLIIMLEQLAYAENSSPNNYSFSQINHELPDFQSTHLESYRFTFLNHTFYTLAENNITKIEISGNPYSYINHQPEIINYLLDNIKSLNISVISNNENTGLSLLRNNHVEIFYLTINDLVNIPNLKKFSPLYFYNYSLGQVSPQNKKDEFLNRYNQIKLLQFPLEHNNIPVFGKQVLTNFSTFNPNFSNNGLHIFQGYSIGIIGGYHPKQKGLELNLGKIFDKFETNNNIPFIKYNTTIEKKGESNEDVKLSYNKINTEFSRVKGNAKLLGNWNTTNRRVYDEEIMKQINEYYYFQEKALIFQVIYQNKIATVSLKYDGNVMFIYTYDMYSDLNFISGFYETLHNLITKISQIEPILSKSEFNADISQQIINSQTSDSYRKEHNFNYYLNSVGYKIYYINYIIDIFWNKQYLFDNNRFQQEYVNTFNYYFEENFPGTTSSPPKPSSFSTDIRKIVYLKQIGKYLTYSAPKKVGRTAISNEIVVENKIDKFNTFVLFDTQNLNKQTLRIIFANLHTFDDLTVNKLPVLNSLRYFLISIEPIYQMNLPKTNRNNNSIDNSPEILNFLNKLISTEEDRLNKEDYKKSINMPYPKGKIRSILSKELFNPKSDASRGSNVGDQPYGITQYRYLYRLIVLLNSLANRIFCCKELELSPFSNNSERVPEIKNSIYNIKDNVIDLLNNTSLKFDSFRNIEININNILINILKWYEIYREKFPILSNEFVCQTEFEGGQPSSLHSLNSSASSDFGDNDSQISIDTDSDDSVTSSQESMILAEPISTPDESAPKTTTTVSKKSTGKEDLISKMQTLNKISYLLYLYKFGLEYKDIYWLCVPNIDEKDNNILLPLFESTQTLDIHNNTIITPKRDPLFEKYNVYNYDNDYVQYRPNTNHSLACNFIKRIFENADANLNKGNQVFPDKSNFYISFLKKRPKCYYNVINSDGKYSKFYQTRLEELEEYKTSNLVKDIKPTELSGTNETLEIDTTSRKKDDESLPLSKSTVHNFKTYKHSISANAVGANSPLPGKLNNKINSTNYRILYTGSEVDKNSFLKPFSMLSGLDNSLFINQTPDNIRDRIIKQISNKDNQLFYFFNNGLLPYIFGSPIKLYDFIKTSYINETFLWQIITYPGIIKKQDSFNLFIINSFHDFDNATENITLKMPPPYLMNTFNRDYDNLVLLQNDFGYHLVYKLDSSGSKIFLKSNDHLINILSKNIIVHYNESFSSSGANSNQTGNLYNPDMMFNVPSFQFLKINELIQIVKKINTENYPFKIFINKVFLINDKIIQYVVLEIKENRPELDNSTQNTFNVYVPIQPTDTRNLWTLINSEYSIPLSEVKEINLPTIHQLLKILDILRKFSPQFDYNKFLTLNNGENSALGISKSNILYHGVNSIYGQNYYFKPINYQESGIGLNPHLANLETIPNSYNNILIDTYLLRETTKAIETEITKSNFYKLILRYLSNQIRINPNLLLTIKNEIKNNMFDLPETVQNLLDKFLTFSDTIDKPSIVPFQINDNIVESSDSTVQISDNKSAILSPSEYKLLLPKNMIKQRDLYNFLNNDINNNQYSLKYFRESSEELFSSGLIKINEIVLNNQNTDIYLNKIDSYIDKNFIMYLEKANYYQTAQLIISDAGPKKTLFDISSSFVEFNYPGQSIYYENDLIQPDFNIKLLKKFLTMAKINTNIEDIYTQIFELLAENPEFRIMYYYYYYSIYASLYSNVKIKYGKDGRSSTLIFDILKTIKPAKSDDFNKLRKLILDSGRCLDIDWYIISYLYKINILIFYNNNTNNLNIYQNNSKEEWFGLLNKSNILYPLIIINKQIANISSQASKFIKYTDKQQIFRQSDINKFKWNNWNYNYINWKNYLISTLKDSNYNADIKILFGSIYPPLTNIDIESNTFTFIDQPPKADMSTITPPEKSIIINIPTKEPLSRKSQSASTINEKDTDKFDFITKLIAGEFHLESLRNLLDNSNPETRKSDLIRLNSIIKKYLSKQEITRENILKIITNAITISESSRVSKEIPKSLAESSPDESGVVSESKGKLDLIIKEITNQFKVENLRNLLNNTEPEIRKKDLVKLSNLIKRHLKTPENIREIIELSISYLEKGKENIRETSSTSDNIITIPPIQSLDKFKYEVRQEFGLSRIENLLQPIDAEQRRKDLVTLSTLINKYLSPDQKSNIRDILELILKEIRE